MSYTQLKTDVADWMHRTDLESKMDSFCVLAETDINSELRVAENETRAVIAVDDAFTDLPGDYLETRALQVEASGARIGLKLMSPDRLDTLYSFATGRVRGGAIHGGQLELRPAPTVDAPTNIEWSYYQRVPTLTTNSTNDILDNYPLVYLSSMLFHANKYVQDDEQATYWANVYNNQIKAANRISSRYHVPSVA